MYVVVVVSSSPNVVAHVSLDHLHILHAFLSCLLASSSHKCHNMSPIDYHVMLDGNVIYV